MTKTDAPAFDAAKLDDLMKENGVDVTLASSSVAVRHLLGGYRFFFQGVAPEIGLSRHLPFVIYPAGDAAALTLVGAPMEAMEWENGAFTAPFRRLRAMTTEQSVALAVARLRELGADAARIGVELEFLPARALELLRAALPEARFVEIGLLLAELRAVKTPRELALLRAASDNVVDAMLATVAAHGPGSRKRDVVATLRREEEARGLTFLFGQCNLGPSFNRAPSDQIWEEGQPMCLDSGGALDGFIGDLARMAVAGEPDPELVDLLAAVEAIQQKARLPIRAGAFGRQIFEVATPALETSPWADHLEFVAHGVGLVNHEAPWLAENGPVPYPPRHRDAPLEAGMVLSLETTLKHPTRGFVKLEDTLAVTADGYEGFGDHGRSWNRAGKSQIAN